MNDRTELLTSNYKPIIAITVYRTANQVTGRGEYYLESHDINDAGQVMQGKPLKQESIQGIVDVFFDERKNMTNISGMLPENLLGFSYLPGGHFKMIWYRPAEIRVVHFASQLKIETTRCWVPATLYVVDRDGLDVFALKSNTRPKLSSQLMIAPYFNVGDEGSVCLGNAQVKKPKDKTYENLIKYWEDLFWLSEFTHLNGSDAKTVTKLEPLWRRIAKSKCKLKWSDLNELKPIKSLTLKNIL